MELGGEGGRFHCHSGEGGGAWDPLSDWGMWQSADICSRPPWRHHLGWHCACCKQGSQRTAWIAKRSDRYAYTIGKLVGRHRLFRVQAGNSLGLDTMHNWRERSRQTTPWVLPICHNWSCQCRELSHTACRTSPHALTLGMQARLRTEVFSRAI